MFLPSPSWRLILSISILGALLALVANFTLVTEQVVAPSDTAKINDPSINEDTMSIRRAAPIIFPAAKQHTATVIFIHGLGDSGHGWASAMENWRRRQRLEQVKFILPHAPIIPITVNGGMPMPGWFDVTNLGGNAETLGLNEDANGIKTSSEYFQDLIQKEIDAGISSDRIIIGGFSQGGAMSILSGLTSKHKLAGIVGMSSWLLLSRSFADMVSPEDPNRQTPVAMFHGDQDPIVRFDRAEMSMKKLKELGYNVSWKVYPGMQHSACPEELDEVESFISSRLPPKA